MRPKHKCKNVVAASIFAASIFFSCHNSATEKNAHVPASKSNSAVKYLPKEKLIVDIQKLINEPPEVVSKFLGHPNKTIHHPKDCATIDKCDLEVHYKKDSVTVLFVDQRAYWFEFDSLLNFPFEANMSMLFGLARSEPTYLKGNDVAWYKEYLGIKNISFVESKKKPGFIDYAVVTIE